MAISHEEMLDLFCNALEMKEKKRALYDDALKACGDNVGKETFRYLCASEARHIEELQEIYEKLKKGSSWGDACKFVEPEDEDIQQVFRKIAEKHKQATQQCSDDASALDTGIELEEASIRFFEDKLQMAAEESHKEFLKRMAVDERQHRTALADLKFYYTDPEAWFMEKSGARLDGAGPMA